MSRRTKISKAITSLINTNLEGTTYTSNIFDSAEDRLRFWDEIGQFPYVSVVSGDEYKEYQPGGHKWNYLSVIIRIYTKGEEPDVELEQFFEDIETLLDNNNNLEYDTNEELTSLTITSFTSDEGVLRPMSVGEINIVARYSTYSACI